MEQHVCPWWLAYTFDNPLRRLFHAPEKSLGPYLAEGMTAMDVGCGMGFFSIGMAKVVGPTGRVISVDLQQKMLDVLMRRAEKAGVANRIQTHRCEPERIGLDTSVDFILAFWMVHEAPDAMKLLRELDSYLRPGGKLLITEPSLHVSAEHFEETIAGAQQIGLKLSERPNIRFSMASLFVKTDRRSGGASILSPP